MRSAATVRASALMALLFAADSAQSAMNRRTIEVVLLHAVRERAAFLFCANRDGDTGSAHTLVSGWNRDLENFVTVLRANSYPESELAALADRFDLDKAEPDAAARGCTLLGNWKQHWQRYGLTDPSTALLPFESK
jgi:hypothetical protein